MEEILKNQNETNMHYEIGGNESLNAITPQDVNLTETPQDVNLNEANLEESENQDCSENSQSDFIEEIKADKNENDNPAPNSFEEIISRLKKENAEKSKEFEAAKKELNEIRIQNAAENLIRELRGKNPRLISKLIDFSKAYINENGELQGVEEQLSSLISSDPYLFSQSLGKGSLSCFTPEEGGDFSENGKQDFSQLTYSQMLNYLENK